MGHCVCVCVCVYNNNPVWVSKNCNLLDKLYMWRMLELWISPFNLKYRLVGVSFSPCNKGNTVSPGIFPVPEEQPTKNIITRRLAEEWYYTEVVVSR